MTALLETKHLILREFEESDLDALYAIVSDPDVMRYVEDGKPLTREQTAHWIALSRQNYRSRGYDEYAVVAKSSGELIGWCGLVTPTTAGGDAEISYGFAKAAWGKGYGKEAARAMLNWGFEQLGLDTILGTVDPANEASIQIFKRLGMEYMRFEMDEHNLPTLVYTVVNVEKRKRDLEDMRARTIKQLYDAFEITLRRGQPSRLVAKPDSLPAPHVERVFAGKRWDALIGSGTMINEIADVDSLDVMTKEAFVYYLPAFLLTVMNRPFYWSYPSVILSMMESSIGLLSDVQIEAVLSFFEYQAAYWELEGKSDHTKALEPSQLEFMLYLDERKQKKAKS